MLSQYIKCKITNTTKDHFYYKTNPSLFNWCIKHYKSKEQDIDRYICISNENDDDDDDEK